MARNDFPFGTPAPDDAPPFGDGESTASTDTADEPLIGFDGTELDGLTELDDGFVTDALVERVLARHPIPFAKDGDAWRGMPLSFGCCYAEVQVRPVNNLARVAVDTGIRMPARCREEANKLILLGNNTFRLSGFKPLEPGEHAIMFAFDLDNSMLESPEEPSDADGLPDNDGGDGFLSRFGRMIRGRQDEDTLSLCLGLALSTVRAYAPKFNAIAYGGRTALDVFAD